MGNQLCCCCEAAYMRQPLIDHIIGVSSRAYLYFMGLWSSFCKNAQGTPAKGTYPNSCFIVYMYVLAGQTAAVR